MFQSTPSAKTEWRQESGYSQRKLWPKEMSPLAMLTALPIHARAATATTTDCAPKGQACHLLGG